MLFFALTGSGGKPSDQSSSSEVPCNATSISNVPIDDSVVFSIDIHEKFLVYNFLKECSEAVAFQKTNKKRMRMRFQIECNFYKIITNKYR